MSETTKVFHKVDVALWKEVKIEAVRRGITARKLVEIALRNELKVNERTRNV